MSYKKSHNLAVRPISAPNANDRPLVWMVLVLGVVLGLFWPVQGIGAEQKAKTPVFFETLYDIPVMVGLEEVKGDALLFDKPDGKIAYVKAVSNTLLPDDIQHFYAQTLPQMGWEKVKENQYVRGDEQLKIDIKSQNQFKVVEFTLSPSP